MRETPSFTEFDPNYIKWQINTTKLINGLDYTNGIQEFLLSGSIGSAKSLFMAHNIVKHGVKFEKARALLGRKTMPDLKDTLIATVKDHMEGDFIEGEDYEFNETKQKWTLFNGSEFISRAWFKKNFTSFRSLKLSFAAIEEATENEIEHWPFYDAIKQRLGRLPNVPQNIMMSATNPAGPEHPCYKYFMIDGKNHSRRHVVYSLTTDNPFLPKWYVDNLKEDLPPDEVQRMIYGQWVSMVKERIYYNFNTERNFRNDRYIVNLDYPIDLMFDFNIGQGKPMSMAVGQHIDGVFHIARTFIVEGVNTHQIMQEIKNSGLLEKKTHFRVFGDASGKNRDTRSKKTDYDIICKHISMYERNDGSVPTFSLHVPLANPPIRKRHNLVNAKFYNANGKVRLYIYKNAKDAVDGFLNTKFKKGAGLVEDDSFKFQHVTTAIGYWVTKVMSDLTTDQRVNIYKAV